ncbi:hypothetical protein COLO4_35594 [Corchorus olitorius]|uniref:Retrotransposon gag protein n=1 Tax=Corchorus olitorius TaxID=93759 RepID=A0A1R3GEW6_9ROSI|nr:hypothetical protein COLO4_35594 [Corchorus olitorius]
MTKAFLAHFKYLMDLAPTRDTLTNMARKPEESLTAYGQRFREVALMVPRLPEREVNSLFLLYPAFRGGQRCGRSAIPT